MSGNGDQLLMTRALALARRGEGLTRPNPPVGAVLADARGNIIAEGWHRRAGTPHAEIVVLNQAGPRARGATLAVTLEPCCTWGRTPPCVDRILAAGVQRVLVGAIDPNPRHQGRGLRRLRQGGVTVIRLSSRGSEAESLIAPFATRVETGRPWLTLKLALTLDGRIADRKGASRWITGPMARRRVQALRRTADAILVGSNTVRHDDPSLIPRPAQGRRPWRVVTDARGTISDKARILTDNHASHTIVATTSACPVAVRAAFTRCGAQVWICRSKGGEVSLRDLSRRLGRLGALHVLCEGGGQLAASLIQAGWVNALEWFIAPRLLGARGVPALGNLPGFLSLSPSFSLDIVERLGPDLHLRYGPKKMR